MAVCNVLNTRAEKVGEVDLNDALFNIEVNPGILHEVVCMQRAARRSGNASTRCKGEISGGGVKPWRQKGTGRAYAYSLPKKVRKLALRMAMSARNQEGKLLVLDKFEMPAVKTKDFVATMKRLAADNCLIVVEAMEKNLDLSSRNVIGVKVLPVAGLNVYDILKYDKLMLLQASLDGIERRLTV